MLGKLCNGIYLGLAVCLCAELFRKLCVNVRCGEPQWRFTASGCFLMYCTLSRCRSLGCCMLPLLDVVVRSTTDKSSDDVAVRSRSALLRFSEQRLVSGARPLIEALEENVFYLATQLPNQMSVPGDDVHVC